MILNSNGLYIIIGLFIVVLMLSSISGCTVIKSPPASARSKFTLNITGNITIGHFLAKSSTYHTGSFSFSGKTGYQAGDAICNSDYVGSHFCTQQEVMASIPISIVGWSGEAWTSTGSAKYSPADVPVNDCNGWTWGSTGSYLGNWWYFNSTTGGDGRTGHCMNSLRLACCV